MSKNYSFLLLIGAGLLLVRCQSDVTLSPHPATTQVTVKEQAVTLDEAIVVASEFFVQKRVDQQRANSKARLNATKIGDSDPWEAREIKETRQIKDAKETVAYVINYKDDKGFALISADKRFTPVVAFADNGEFGSDTLGGVRDWLLDIKSIVKGIRKENKEQGPKEKALWGRYLKTTKSSKGGRSTSDEEPPSCPEENEYFYTGSFTNDIAQYSQSYGYSYYAPSDGGCIGNSGNCGRKFAGCGAVAMAIVMRYYRRPVMNITIAGESMLLDSSGYDAMPKNWGEMQFDCGRPPDNARRLSMLIRFNGGMALSGYGVLGNCNTWTLPGNIDDAFRRMGYSDGGWWDGLSYGHWQSVVSELSQRRPVLFTGTYGWIWNQPGNAHIWVGDGMSRYVYSYSDLIRDQDGNWQYNCLRGESMWISMNWGWGGQSNGMYYRPFQGNIGSYDTVMRALVHIRP